MQQLKNKRLNEKQQQQLQSWKKNKKKRLENVFTNYTKEKQNVGCSLRAIWVTLILFVALVNIIYIIYIFQLNRQITISNIINAVMSLSLFFIAGLKLSSAKFAVLLICGICLILIGSLSMLIGSLTILDVNGFTSLLILISGVNITGDGIRKLMANRKKDE